MSDDKERGAGFWVAVGCGALAVLGVCGFCVGPGAVGMLLPGGMFWDQPSSVPITGPAPAPYGAGQGPVLPPAPGPVVPAFPSDMDDPIADLPPLSRTVEIEVTRVTAAVASVGDTCRFEVERVPRTTVYQCRARVECGGRLLYGGETNGFFDCTMPDDVVRLVGDDVSTTAEDSDAAFSVDSDAGTLRIRDDAEGTHGVFELEARIVAVR